MIPNIESGAKMTGLVMYLAGPGKANEHHSQHVVTASSPSLLFAGGGGKIMTREDALELAHEMDSARVVFGTPVTRLDKNALRAATDAGLRGSAALAEATHDENVWHCSLALHPDDPALSDDTWSAIAYDFMREMGFDVDGEATARWVAIRHGETKQGGDHIHIAASRVRDDGSVVGLWFPEPGSTVPRGDRWRSQNVCAQLERKYGLPITSGRAQSYPGKGTSPAQQAIAERLDRKETAQETLSRAVRAAAGASESEAEFVRLVRARGLLIRPRYAPGSHTEVTGYSVALPTTDYSTKRGTPVWHGGGKLGNDLSLPRLRETWITDPAAAADAQSAWEHNRAHIAGIDADRKAPALDKTAPRAGSRPTLSAEDAQARLRSTVHALARSAATEADFVRAVRTHPDVVIRPRYASGSHTEVTGYSVALRTGLYTDGDGKAVWCGGGTLDKSLRLSQLRSRWPSSPLHSEQARAAWRTAAGSSSSPGSGNRRTQATSAEQRSAADAAARWRAKVDSVADRGGPGRAWETAAADTAAVLSAWADRAERGQPRELSRLADSLAAAAGRRRAATRAGRRSMSSGRRLAALILAASGEDTRWLWMAVFDQLDATGRAIGDALQAQGHARRAQALVAALESAGARRAEFVGATAPGAPTIGPGIASERSYQDRARGPATGEDRGRG